MGNLLEKPVTDKETHVLSVLDLGIDIGMSSMQGFRPEMEDDHVMAVIPSCPSHVFLAVFDGHGGSSAAHYSAKNIISVLESTQEWKDYVDKGMSQKKLHDAFIATMRKIDVDMRKVQEAHEDDAFGGCTAVTAIISPSFFVCANAGDSRCVLGNRNYVIPMSRDHKPSDYEERKRVEAAGGSIILDRIEGSLAVARGLGDFEFKRRRDLDQACQMVSCIPEIKVEERRESDDIAILACDGLWDVMSNEEAIELAREILASGEHDMGKVAEEMVDMALERGSDDNISAIVVKFSGAHVGPKELGGVNARRQKRYQEMMEMQRQNQEINTPRGGRSNYGGSNRNNSKYRDLADE